MTTVKICYCHKTKVADLKNKKINTLKKNSLCSNLNYIRHIRLINKNPLRF